MDWMAPLAAIAAAYLLGSISFAVIVSRAFGLADPRSYGSGNPGATNVLRSGRKAAALLTLLLDALKGVLPVLVLRGLAPELGEPVAAAVALAAFLGHLYPVFFGFQGGKGVATAAGAIFALNPVLGLATLASFAMVVGFTRFVSLGSMVAALFAPFYQLLIWGPGPLFLALLAMAFLLIWRHRSNIAKLRAGTEGRLGQKSVASR
ncbi:glycerol-3-phosphate 1-O-acyltransferase PlsY [Aquariibacter albus]|uniref:Glycerol-3-phosphate acyltransferase n=1 Tax=Aquariibacter albus TaxID=2759899 RepID=A0A839HM82_9BURK|nr:glycerol-3-phosphate 1-O-acyltransferase PlsY [Aquariibacter albus]MBB1160678.1 glycerol-3-phosphate 1-O-acyltransferase PlsY [Aquariibacter albus]